MDLRLDEEQQALGGVLHELAAEVIRPAARDCEAWGDATPAIRQALNEIGLTAPVPEAFGGQGLVDPVTALLVAEELGWGDPGMAYALLTPGAAGGIIAAGGTPGQQAEYLPALARGASTAVAIAEREAGLQLRALEGSPGAAGPAGTKYAVTGMDGASVLVVLGAGPAAWLVDPATVSSTVEDKLGLRSARTHRVRLDAAVGDLLPGDVCAAAGAAVLTVAGIALGLGRAALEYATAYAKQRRAFGKPIGTFQGVSFLLADRAIDLDAARLAAWEAAGALAGGDPRAASLVPAACHQAVHAALASATDAIQVLGGHGYMRDHPVELWYRDAMTLCALVGAGQVAG